MSEERATTRARRARVLVVGAGERMRDLASLARRKVAHVIEVPTLFDAIDECRRASAAEPIAGVFISPSCEHYDAAAVVDAFMRLDPSLPLILAVAGEEEDLTAVSTVEGFEDSISLPAREPELSRLLEDLGAVDTVPAARNAGNSATPATLAAAIPTVPAPRSVVEEIVERAQERAHERVVDRSVESRTTESRTTESRTTESRTTEPRTTEPRTTESRPTESRGVDREPPRNGARWRSDGTGGSPPLPPPHVGHGELPPARIQGKSDPAPDASMSPARGRATPAFQMPARETRPPDIPSDAPPSDLDLVRAVQDGHDVHGAAMRVLRHHLGSADVRFVAEPRPGEEIAVELDRRGVRQIQVLRADGRPYGTLLSRTIDEQCLQAWATWLGTWLDLDEQHQELRRQAWTDELTGAGNRRAFDQVLSDTVRLAQRDWRFFGLMLFDIDDFKQYNDHHGHDVGDEVLKEIVELLRASIRRGDHIFRIGGDEFAVLFCDPDGPRRGGTIDRESAATIAQRFQRAVRSLSLTHIGLSGPGTISVSTGFAAFPWHGLDPISLYRAADAFCLESKRAGKNRITFGSGLPDGERSE
jgi:diguanylate cyclase (GGDEF)-like protein